MGSCTRRSSTPGSRQACGHRGRRGAVRRARRRHRRRRPGPGGTRSARLGPPRRSARCRRSCGAAASAHRTRDTASAGRAARRRCSSTIAVGASPARGRAPSRGPSRRSRRARGRDRGRHPRPAGRGGRGSASTRWMCGSTASSGRPRWTRRSRVLSPSGCRVISTVVEPGGDRVALLLPAEGEDHLLVRHHLDELPGALVAAGDEHPVDAAGPWVDLGLACPPTRRACPPR